MEVFRKGRGAQTQTHNRFEKMSCERFPEQEVSEEGEVIQDGGTQFITVFPKSILNKVESPDIPGMWSMNPYQGCEHGCIYCYARNSHEYWGYNAARDFEQKILIKQNAAELLDKKLSSRNWQASPIMLSGNTDCYQPVEKKLRITRSLLEVCLKHKHPLGIITKNALICRDLDILSELARLNLLRVSISLTSLNEELRRLMEPRTASAGKRLQTIKSLSQAGIPVNVMFAPIIPGLNSDEVFAVARAASTAGAMGMGYTMLRLNGVLGFLFEDWIRKAFPLKAGRVMNLIKTAQGGKVNNSTYGERMQGHGVLAESIAQQVKLARRKFKLDKTFPGYNLHLYETNKHAQLKLFV